MSVIREFQPISKGSEELVGTWNIVLGQTPDEPEQRRGGPGGPPQRAGRENDEDIKELLFGPGPF